MLQSIPTVTQVAANQETNPDVHAKILTVKMEIMQNRRELDSIVTKKKASHCLYLAYH